MRGTRARRRWIGCAAVVMAAAVSCGHGVTVSGTRVDASLHDFRIATSRTAVPSGTVTIVIHNRAPATHEFLVLRTDLAPEQLPIAADGLPVARLVGPQPATGRQRRQSQAAKR